MPDQSNALVLKDVCDTCGCATGWTRRGYINGDKPSEWDTVASQVVSSTSPNWDFGAREAGVWKITAFPEPSALLRSQYPPSWRSYDDDLNWNSGGVTLDNHGYRDRSYLGQFWAFNVPIPYGWNPNRYSIPIADLGQIGANGHFPNQSTFKPNTWGHGFTRRGGNFPSHSQHHAVWAQVFKSWMRFADRTILQPVGAIFVWASGLNEYALPADLLTEIATHPAGSPPSYPRGAAPYSWNYYYQPLHEGFRRHILPHTDGGTIAGSISDVGTNQGPTGEDLTGEKWRVRLHKLAPTPDTLWLQNEYNKGIKAIRFKRWSSHKGHLGDNYIWGRPGGWDPLNNWVFPLWSFDAELDRVAVPNMNACHHSLFKTDLQAPFSWVPEYFFDGALNADGSSEIVARDRSLFNWDNGTVAPSDSTDGAAAAEASSGESFADGSYWIDGIARKVYTFDGTSWTLHPLPPANGMVRQSWTTYPGKKTATSLPVFPWQTISYGPDRYSVGASWVGWTATPIFEDDTLGGELRLEGNGRGYGLPSYAAGPQNYWKAGQGPRPTSRVHNSSIGGVPFCYNLGHLNPNDPQIIAGGNPTDPADEAVRIY